MKNPHPIVLLAALLTLAGCMSAGNDSLRQESEASISQKIVEGKTTKAQVRADFGSPLKTSFTDSGLEIWEYDLAKMSADAVDYIPFVGMFGGSASGTQKQLVLLFDDKGIVKRCSMSESPTKARTGLFNQ